MVEKELKFFELFSILGFFSIALVLTRQIWWSFLSKYALACYFIIFLIIVIGAYFIWYMCHIFYRYSKVTTRDLQIEIWKSIKSEFQNWKLKENKLKCLLTMPFSLLGAILKNIVSVVCKLFRTLCCKHCCVYKNQETQPQETELKSNDSISK